jgi:galactoside O-acetyltransferase
MTGDFLADDELAGLGLGRLGENVRVSRHALLLFPEHIRLGSDVRIDAFCLLVGNREGITVGDHVHLSAYTSILGGRGTVIGDFCTISARCTIFTSGDDFSGASLTNPTVPDELRRTTDAPVHIHAHSAIGAGSVVLPGVSIGPSAAVGALTLVKEDVPELTIVAGTPMRRIGPRLRDHLTIAEKLRPSSGSTPRPPADEEDA